MLKANASGKFFNDFIAPRLLEDGLEVLYKVDGIGEDGLGYRYFTGPKRDGATKGKSYSGVPLTRVEEINSGGAVKEKVIMNYLNFADSFGNSRSEGGVELRSGKKQRIFLPRNVSSSGPLYWHTRVVFLSIESGEVTAVMRATGERHGRATFSP